MSNRLAQLERELKVVQKELDRGYVLRDWLVKVESLDREFPGIIHMKALAAVCDVEGRQGNPHV